MKRIICVLLVTVLIVSMLLSCSIPLRNSGEEKQRIVVQLDQDYWLASGEEHSILMMQRLMMILRI